MSYWFHALGQRSQRRPTWEKLAKVFDQWLPVPQVVHEFPDTRFDASRPRAAYPRWFLPRAAIHFVVMGTNGAVATGDFRFSRSGADIVWRAIEEGTRRAVRHG